MQTLSDTIWISADALIERMKQSGDAQYNLVREHLETAHACFLGAMTVESAHNLELARQATNALSGKPLHHELKETIGALLTELHSSAAPTRGGLVPASNGPAPAGIALSDFFQREGVSFGLFYPKEHVVAVFSSFETAQAAQSILRGAGFRMWEVTAVPGEEVERFLQDLRAHRSLWDEVVAQISRLLDTEVNLVDRYIHWARTGHGFLIAHSPTESDAEGISNLLNPLDPMAMHWFMAGYIRHLSATK
jgi:hypothetical protein